MRLYSMIVVVFLLLVGCSKSSDGPSLAKPHNEIQNIKPKNIYWCESGSIVGINISCCEDGQVSEYFLNGKKLITSANENLAKDEDNGYQYLFKRDGARLTVYVANSLGEGMDILNCVHHVE